jgi:peptide/nickel transport system ATP-binding protein
MDVRRILAEPLIVHGVQTAERERRIRQVLEEVRLTPADDYLPKFPHMLSGGQQQRVVIARALILRPAMIIADEPVSMLDASVRVEILNLLRHPEPAHKLTLAFITHDLSTVRHFAERIFVMYAGKMVEQAPGGRPAGSPQHPYTQALLAAIADPDAANADRRAGRSRRRAAQPAQPAAGLPLPSRAARTPSPGSATRDAPRLRAPARPLSACWLHALLHDISIALMVE